jgi:MFS family permease
MGHAPDDRTASAAGAADPGALGPVEVEVEPYPGHGRKRIDLRNPAPFGWTPAVALGFVALVDRADSAMVGGVLKTLQEDFGFSDATAGILLSAPSVAALLLVVLAGKLADTRSRKNVLVVVIAAWGLLTFGAAAAPTFALFFLARVLLGMATPLNIPASASIAGDLYMSKARTKAFAILRVMEYLGFPLGVLIGGVVSQTLGWRAAFLIMGVPAILLSIFIAVWLKEPKRGLADDLAKRAEAAGIVQSEIEPITEYGEVPEAGEPVNAEHANDRDDYTDISIWKRSRLVLSIPTLRAIILGQALLFAGFSGLFGFAALFFARVQDLPEGAAAGISGGMGLIGLSVGGILATKIGDRYHGVKPGWRVTVAGCTLVGAALCVLVMAAVPVLPLQILMYLLINFANIIALSNLGASTADVIPARLRGTGFAVMQFLVTIGSSLGAIIVGTVSGRFIASKMADSTVKAPDGTDLRQGDLNDLQDQIDDQQELLDAAADAGQPTDAIQATIDGLQAQLTQFEDAFFPAQATGIQWGIGALVVVFVVGGLLIFRARATYERDAKKALADATGEAGEPAGYGPQH